MNVNQKASVKKCVAICAPPYENSSAGVMVLHDLCHTLLELGYIAHIVMMSSDGFRVSTEESLYDPKLKKLYFSSEEEARKWFNYTLDYGVVLYPEIIPGNPLEAKHVVRYFLNGDGVLTGVKTGYKDTDYILTWSRKFFRHANGLLAKSIRSKFMHDVNATDFGQRTLDLTYFGKGAKYADCFRINGSILLSSVWPQSKEELAILLRNTRYLFCWDNLTALNSDAVFCGAKVVLLQFQQLTEEEYLTEFENNPPYLKGILNGSSVSVNETPDYYKLRENYLKKAKESEISWPSNVNENFTSIFRYFKLV